jgi:hypothetical protein
MKSLKNYLNESYIDYEDLYEQVLNLMNVENGKSEYENGFDNSRQAKENLENMMNGDNDMWFDEVFDQLTDENNWSDSECDKYEEQVMDNMMDIAEQYFSEWYN